MTDQPRLTKLGAKWVEVRKRRDQGFRSGLNRAFDNVASNNPFSIARNMPLRGCPKLVEVASLTKREQPGLVSHPEILVSAKFIVSAAHSLA
jgi:hypothetical protein